MAEDVILVEAADGVATVTLNRPRARNALNRELRSALPRTISELDADGDVDVIILTGADPAFCAGLDLKELGAATRDDRPNEAEPQGPPPWGPLPAHTVPIIGAVNGPAVTGGLEVALACDLLVASERASFADTHARVGVMPGWGLSVLLPEAVGVRRARELSLTGNYLDAETALTWGLVNHVVPHGELLPFCRGLAADMVSNDQPGVRRMLRAYHEQALLHDAEIWTHEAQVAREWAVAGGGDPAEVERRRQAIISRGQTQSG